MYVALWLHSCLRTGSKVDEAFPSWCCIPSGNSHIHKWRSYGNFNCFYKDNRHLLKRLKEPRICIAPTRPYPRKPFCRTTFCSANQVVLIQTNFNRTQEARSDVLDRYWITTFWAKFAIGRFDEILFEQATPNNLADRLLKKYYSAMHSTKKATMFNMLTLQQTAQTHIYQWAMKQITCTIILRDLWRHACKKQHIWPLKLYSLEQFNHTPNL